MAQILPFPVTPDASPIALFVRIGNAHKKLADLYAAGRLKTNRVVVDASRVRFQEEFLKRLREDEVEIVLDTEIAELSSPRRFPGKTSSPWLRQDRSRTFRPGDFTHDNIERLADRIAEFAVENSMTAVLSPTHYLNDKLFDGWLNIDREFCLALRKALDRAGGEAIALDYPVIVANSHLKDIATREAITAGLDDLPVDNIWIRTSGMDGLGGSLKTVQFLSALDKLHNLGRPIIADYLGGLTGLAALAFGSVSGVAHGVGEKERFDAGDWHLDPEPREEDDTGFGPTPRVEVPDLGKAPTKRELELLAGAPGGRRVCSCNDRSCCPHGLDDMLRDPRSHAAYRATSVIRALEEIPPTRRETYFIEKPMADAVRTSRAVATLRPVSSDATRLGVDSEALMKRFTEHSFRIDKLAQAFSNLAERRSTDIPRAKIVTNRDPVAKNPKEAKK